MYWQNQVLAKAGEQQKVPSLLVEIENCTATLEDSLAALHNDIIIL